VHLKEVLREAINNVLFHRQYSIQGPIKIALFTVRLEKLIATGRIVRVGKGPKTKYQIRGY
jgi:predicted HTH transcriptional regulator